MHYQYFPPVVIELEAEIQRHEPLLIKLLQLGAYSDLSDKLGTIAAHCDIAMDGMYDNDSIVRLCYILVDKLKASRSELILPAGTLSH
jgi:hypothetical protein